MDKLLVFAAVLGLAYAGGRRLSVSESRAILDGFQDLCKSGKISANGGLVELDGEKTWVYCKQAGGKTVVENTEEKTFDVDEPPPQAVFLNPSDISLRQKVLVSGTVKAARTKIFYVPPKVDTNVEVDVTSQTERPNKPTVYFLNKGEGATSGKSLSSDPVDSEEDNHSDDSLESGQRISKKSLLRFLRKNQGKVQLLALPNEDDDGLDSASSEHISKISAPPAIAVGAGGPQTRQVPASPYTHAIKINGEQGQSRLLFLRKTN